MYKRKWSEFYVHIQRVTIEQNRRRKKLIISPPVRVRRVIITRLNIMLKFGSRRVNDEETPSDTTQISIWPWLTYCKTKKKYKDFICERVKRGKRNRSRRSLHSVHIIHQITCNLCECDCYFPPFVSVRQIILFLLATTTTILCFFSSILRIESVHETIRQIKFVALYHNYTCTESRFNFFSICII